MVCYFAPSFFFIMSFGRSCLLLASEKSTDSLSCSASKSWVHFADGVTDFQDGHSLASMFTPGGGGFARFHGDSISGSLDGDSFVVSDAGVFKGVLVLQVSWVFAQLKSSALSGFDQESVVLSNDGPDDGLRHIFCCSKLL